MWQRPDSLRNVSDIERPEAYAHTWPARFFETLQPGQDCSVVGARWVDWLFTSRSFPGVVDTAWEAMGERLLTLLAAAPLSP